MTTGQPHPHRRPDLCHPRIAGTAQPTPQQAPALPDSPPPAFLPGT
jgi:hypothetical protein